MNRGGSWTRLVDTGELSRLFFVRTTARWRGYDVTVQRVMGDTATVQYRDFPRMEPSFELTAVDKDGTYRGEVPVV